MSTNPNTEIYKIVEQIKENTASLYNGSRDIIWSLNSQNDGLFEIAEHLRDIGVELFGETQVDFEYQHNIAKNNSLKLKLDYSRNLTMIMKEAYSNILKYAEAENVKVDVEISGQNQLLVRVKDDGKGFDLTRVSKGNGLKNIENRVKRMNGELNIVSSPENGTEISIHLTNIFI